MPRITPVTAFDAPKLSQPLLDGVKQSLGMVPNLIATLAHSPAALQSYLGFSQALNDSTLSAPLREQISVAVAGENGCDYCASAHTLLGRNAGVSPEELRLNLQGGSRDPKVKAALDFSNEIIRQKGHVSNESLVAIRALGFTEAEIVDIAATVALNIFTNYFNHIAETDIDFPMVATPKGVACDAA
jgi:uncharacterized peroxidase-related enzyme